MTMIKVWEETWTARVELPETDGARIEGEDGFEVAHLGQHFVLENGDGQPVEELHADKMDVARCRLAAAAPNMALMLLQLEWSAQNQYGQRQCPACGGDEEKPNESRTGHMGGCQWVGVMRKAGVR